MIGPWTEIKLTVTVLAPLHVGTGEASCINGVGKEETEVALVAHDLSGKPVLPASSIKGALRALAGSDADTLFGPSTIAAATVGKAGMVSVWNAMLLYVPPNLAGSHADKSLPNGSNGTHGNAGMLIEARTAVEPALGVAFENRLFHQQMVAPCCTFALRLGLLDRQDNGAAALQKLLALICKDGLTLGGGSGYGQGRLQGDIKTLEVSQHKLGADGELAKTDMSSAWLAEVDAVDVATAASENAATLILMCQGPYISLDSSMSGSGNQKDGVPALQPLKLPGHNNKARLSGASLHGALRARAVWLSRLKDNAHRDNRDLRSNLVAASAARMANGTCRAQSWMRSTCSRQQNCCSASMAGAAC
ncbi:MAG: RAMP superfamily CRISPR-associated protein [Nitratireductor sp.]